MGTYRAGVGSTPPEFVMTVAFLFRPDEQVWDSGASVAVSEGQLPASTWPGHPALSLRHLAVLPGQHQGLLPLPHPCLGTQLWGLPALLPAAHPGMHGLLCYR